MFRQIRYTREIITGNFIVDLVGTRQRLVAQPRFLCRVLNIDASTILGSADITAATASELGFVNVCQQTEEAIAV